MVVQKNSLSIELSREAVEQNTSPRKTTAFGMTSDRARVLLVGCGGIGTIAALNLEAGGLAQVTAVLRSNFDVVKSNGFTIKSCEHGDKEGWRPTEGQFQ